MGGEQGEACQRVGRLKERLALLDAQLHHTANNVREADRIVTPREAINCRCEQLAIGVTLVIGRLVIADVVLGDLGRPSGGV